MPATRHTDLLPNGLHAPTLHAVVVMLEALRDDRKREFLKELWAGIGGGGEMLQHVNVIAALSAAADTVEVFETADAGVTASALQRYETVAEQRASEKQTHEVFREFVEDYKTSHSRH